MPNMRAPTSRVTAIGVVVTTISFTSVNSL
jgi:hypothetical protein